MEPILKTKDDDAKSAGEGSDRSDAESQKSKASNLKQGPSPYFFFTQDWRERVKAENPNASFGQLGVLMGRKWRALSDAEKKPYIDKVATNQERRGIETSVLDIDQTLARLTVSDEDGS